MKKANALTYEAAFEELNQILASLQDGSVSMDDLAARMERANVLLDFCRERLRQTESAIEQLTPPAATA